MKGERSTDNIIRKTIFDYIVQNPSVSFQTLVIAFKMNESTLRYHIDYLIHNEDITKRRSGVSNIFFPKLIRNHYRGSENGNNGFKRKEKRVLTIISQEPGITRKGIKKSISMTSKELTYVMSKLNERNLIWEHCNGGEKTYEVVTRDKILSNALVLLIKMFLDKKINEPTFLELKKEVERQIEEEIDETDLEKFQFN
jgi:predicted transcriptional regulator